MIPKKHSRFEITTLPLNPNMLFLVDSPSCELPLPITINIQKTFHIGCEMKMAIEFAPRQGTAIYIDFTQPGMQDIIVQQAIAVATMWTPQWHLLRLVP